MKLFSRLIFSLASNLLSLMAANYLVKGFAIENNFKSFLTVGLIFTLINLFIRPVLKLILSPVIILTFGLGIILVNAVVLYLLEYFSKSVSIDGITPLIYATLIISLVNIIIHFSAKRLYKE